jgi:DNA-binding MarR family transcriptional regulator
VKIFSNTLECNYTKLLTFASMDNVAVVTSCNCLSLRQAARYVSQLYDRYLAPHGITLNQFSILAQLSALGAAPVNEVAQKLVMDRTTLTRNLKPLQQLGLVKQEPNPVDGRSQCVSLTLQGQQLLTATQPDWAAAQAQFEQSFGLERSTALRQELSVLVKNTFSN